MNTTYKVLLAASLVCLSSLASAAALEGYEHCGAAGCPFTYVPGTGIFSGDGYDVFQSDYTILTDGRPHVWKFTYTSADPNVTFSLDYPTQVDSFLLIRGSGPTSGGAYPDFTIAEYNSKGRFTVVTRGPRAVNYCDTRPGPVGGVCGVDWNIFGNGTYLTVNSRATVTGVFTENVPEPSAWALMIAGFGVVGAAARRGTARTIIV